ncbi:MAG: DUF4038 domain-containing protein [Terracidiphilus sp.]
MTRYFNSGMAQVWILRTVAVFACLSTSTIWLRAEGTEHIQFTQSASQVAVFDFVEVTANVKTPTVQNSFTDASITGDFQQAGFTVSTPVEGFCDSADGSIYRIRFMPSKSGVYTYHITFKAGAVVRTYSGKFTALDEHRRGPIRIDPDYQWHFVWEGTGEHYFFNGTTAFFLMGWRDERTIEYSIDRLARLKVNRMRLFVYGRQLYSFGDSAMEDDSTPKDPTWTSFLNPWPAQAPKDLYHPGFDYSRFNVPYWQKIERMLRYARERGMVISLVFDCGDHIVHPEAGGEDEHRYIRYAVDRLAAFSNITWDLGDDLDVYRDEKWTHETGTLIEQWDPYRHLATSHPIHNSHQDRASSWFGFTSYQDWSRSQHAVMLESRRLQEQTGRIIPQANEEYGYEDHYPMGVEAGSDSAEALRRTAWEIYMAGGYQTTGESSRRGTNIWPDTGGGYLNGRGDDAMTMLIGYGHIVDFFTGFDWWKTNPHDELVNNGNYCLAEPGKLYAVYLPHAGEVTIKLGPGTYRGEWFNAYSGQRIPLAQDATGPSWTSPDPPDDSAWRATRDWAILLQRR